jgi:hypothetical protein
MPIFDPDGKCPLLNKKCIKTQCIWYNMLQGTHPQTGAPVQEWGCSIAWIPLLLVENSRHIQGTQAATESFRNEMTKQQSAFNKLLEGSESAKNLAMNAHSIFSLIGDHQRAIQEKNKNFEDETIRQLSNNKVKVKKGNKGKKDVDNNK